MFKKFIKKKNTLLDALDFAIKEKLKTQDYYKKKRKENMQLSIWKSKITNPTHIALQPDPNI